MAAERRDVVGEEAPPDVEAGPPDAGAEPPDAGAERVGPPDVGAERVGPPDAVAERRAPRAQDVARPQWDAMVPRPDAVVPVPRHAVPAHQHAVRPVRQDAAPPLVRQDATPPLVRQDAAPPPVRQDAAPPPVRQDAALPLGHDFHQPDENSVSRVAGCQGFDLAPPQVPPPAPVGQVPASRRAPLGWRVRLAWPRRVQEHQRAVRQGWREVAELLVPEPPPDLGVPVLPE